MSAAPAPWNFAESGLPGSNGDSNHYVTDATGRKIAAVWGKRGEKDATGALMVAAPDMLAVLKLVSGIDIPHEALSAVDAAISKAEGRS